MVTITGHHEFFFKVNRAKVYTPFERLHLRGATSPASPGRQSSACAPLLTIPFPCHPYSSASNQPHSTKQNICAIITPVWTPTSHFPFPTSHFPFPISNFPLPISHFPFPISHFPFPISHFPLPISHFPLPTSHFPFPISHFKFPTSHFPFPISNFPLPISHFPLPASHFPFPSGARHAP